MSHVSDPNAPAFMAKAPPKVPGIPIKNSAPVNSLLTLYLASCAHEVPAPALSSVDESILILSSIFFVAITVPLIPPSLTNRLLPRPIQVIGSSAFSWARNRFKSLKSYGIYKVSAVPPTRHDVCLDIGSFFFNLPINPSFFVEIIICILPISWS